MNPINFDNEQQLEAAFAEAANTFAPRPGLKESLRATVFDRAAHEPEVARWSGEKAGRRRRWVAWAIAASLLVAGTIELSRSETKLVSVAYAELEAALEKADQAGWAHYFEGAREEWVSFRPYRFFSKSPERVIAWDRAANRQYEYDRKANTLTVRYMGLPNNMEVLGSFGEVIRQKISGLEEQGRTVLKGTEKFVGKDAIVYEVTGFRENEGGKYVKLKYFFDPTTDRVLGIEGSGTGWLSWMKFWMVVDYPAEGPNDVYAIGVPQDAKIIDKMPTPEVLALANDVEAALGQEPKQFFQISAEVYEAFSQEYPPNFGIWVEVTCVKEGRLRRDRYGERRLADYEQSLATLKGFRERVLDGGIEATEAWLKDRKPVQVIVGDVRAGEMTTYIRDSHGELLRLPCESALVVSSLARPWGHRMVALDDEGETSVVDRGGRFGALRGIENRSGQSKCATYFNPARGYLCEMHEVIGDGVADVTEVLSYDRTPDGNWFVDRARKSVHNGRDAILVKNYRDDDRDIEARLFDASLIAAADLAAE